MAVLIKRMLRPSLAVVLGLVAGSTVFFLVSIVANVFYPTPPDLQDPQTPEETVARVEAAAVGGLLMVLVGGALGGIVGGAAGGWAALRKAIGVSVVVGALLSLWGVYSFYVFFPDRLWFPIGLFLCFLLLSPLSGGLVSRWKQRPAA